MPGRLSEGATLLIMMNIITVLLCSLANQVLSQTTDISPAKILAEQKTISEHSDLSVTCSTFGLKKNSMIFVYLWKDGFAVKRMTQKQEQYDSTFNISRVGLHHSGNYSCVYSPKKYMLPEVAERGYNVIQILVIANFLPADISVVGPSTVHEGDYVEFRCTVSHTLHTLGECQFIHSYLRKNETILLVKAFDVTQMEVTFTIEGAVLRDSGHYSCMVLPSKCIQENENTLYGKNTVFLEVKVDLVPRVIVTGGVITLMLLLSLCLWWISNNLGRSALCKPCAMSQQANADMLAEQQEQTEGEDLEAQDEEDDSFGMEEEEVYQNNFTAEVFAYSDDCEGAYNVIDEISDEYDDIGQMLAK